MAASKHLDCVIAAVLFGLLLPSVALAQDTVETARFSLTLIGCLESDSGLQTRLQLETGDKVEMESPSSPIQVTVGCGAEQATIELIDDDGRTLARSVDTSNMEPAARLRILSLAIVELLDAPASNVPIVVEPVSGPVLELAAPSFAPEGPKRRSWYAAAMFSSYLSTPVPAPGLAVGARWGSRTNWGFGLSGSFSVPMTSTEIGRVQVLGMTLAGAVIFGRAGRLDGPAAELGLRASGHDIRGLTSRDDVDTSEAFDISAGPFVAGSWRFDVSPDLAIIARTEAGWASSGADATADGVVVWSGVGPWLSIDLGAGFYF